MFTTSTTHALRALAHLSARPGGEPVLGRDLARELGLPAPYLAKVLAALARAGVLVAARGAHGGYRLARPPAETTLMAIVEPLEGKRVRPGCLLRPGEPCDEDAACNAHGAWAGAKAAYVRFLERTTLADIGGNPSGPPRGARRGRAVRSRAGTRRRRDTPSQRPTRAVHQSAAAAPDRAPP